MKYIHIHGHNNNHSILVGSIWRRITTAFTTIAHYLRRIGYTGLIWSLHILIVGFKETQDYRIVTYLIRHSIEFLEEDIHITSPLPRDMQLFVYMLCTCNISGDVNKHS